MVREKASLSLSLELVVEFSSGFPQMLTIRGWVIKTDEWNCRGSDTCAHCSAENHLGCACTNALDYG